MLLLCLLLLQPDPAALRRLFEQEFERHPTAQSARDLGMYLAMHGDPAAARTALQEALRLAPDRLENAYELAMVSSAGEAEPLLERAAAGKDAGLAVRSFEALGHLRDAIGKKSEAATAYRRALALRPSANVLEALSNDVEPAQSIQLLQRALAMNRASLGMRHPQTATTEANLAGRLLNAGQADLAIPMAREAMNVLEERLGADHPRVAVCATILAYAFRAKGDLAGAERYYRRAMAIDKSISDARPLADFLQGP